jgi:predicted esterase
MSSSKSADVISVGKKTFRLQVAYKCIETGHKGEKKPLIIYLHGFAQSRDWMIERFSNDLEKVEAYHLFLEGPFLLLETYLKTQKKLYSWYLFNGDKDEYVSSVEYVSEYLQEVIDQFQIQLEPTEIHMLGYSMGAYLAGYFSLTRPTLIRKCIMINGRLKTEWARSWDHIEQVNFLAIHGEKDDEVSPEKQREHIQILKEKGGRGQFLSLEGDHKINDDMIDACYIFIQSERDDFDE